MNSFAKKGERSSFFVTFATLPSEVLSFLSSDTPVGGRLNFAAVEHTILLFTSFF